MCFGYSKTLVVIIMGHDSVFFVFVYLSLVINVIISRFQMLEMI